MTELGQPRQPTAAELLSGARGGSIPPAPHRAPGPGDPAQSRASHAPYRPSLTPGGSGFGKSATATAAALGEHERASDVAFTNPLSPALAQTLLWMAKTAKALRVYERNNEMLRQFVERTHGLLDEILRHDPELTLTVREDRLLYGRDAVYINADRQEGIPFILYRNAFRRITLVKGISGEEMIELLAAINTDYSSFEYVGEDLVSVLWRLDLPHLRYFTIDALQVAVDGVKEQQEVDRLQGEIDDLVAKLYAAHNANVSDEDLVKGVSIANEDLQALSEIQKEAPEDLDALDVATARAIATIKPQDLAAVVEELKKENHDELMARLIEILCHILIREQSSQEFTQTIELIQQLFDSLLLANRFKYATELVKNLRSREIHSSDLKEIHITRHLLKLLSMEARINHVLDAFNDAKKANSAAEMVEFLRALGPTVVPALMNMLEMLASSIHRRMICDLVGELGVPDVNLLRERMREAKWFVVLDIMNLAQRLPKEQCAQLVIDGTAHSNPKVRAQSIGMLRAYPRGVADEIVGKAIHDDDLDVRLTALRVAASRKSANAREKIEELIKRDDVWDRDPREIRTMLAAYAVVGGAYAVTALDRILNPGFFARSKMTDAQIAAAFALARVGNEEAMASLQRGSRTLNIKVREACKRAMMREVDKEHADAAPDDALAHGAPPGIGSPSLAPQPIHGAPAMPPPASQSRHDPLSDSHKRVHALPADPLAQAVASQSHGHQAPAAPGVRPGAFNTRVAAEPERMPERLVAAPIERVVAGIHPADRERVPDRRPRAPEYAPEAPADLVLTPLDPESIPPAAAARPAPPTSRERDVAPSFSKFPLPPPPVAAPPAPSFPPPPAPSFPPPPAPSFPPIPAAPSTKEAPRFQFAGDSMVNQFGFDPEALEHEGGASAHADEDLSEELTLDDLDQSPLASAAAYMPTETRRPSGPPTEPPDPGAHADYTQPFALPGYPEQPPYAPPSAAQQPYPPPSAAQPPYAPPSAAQQPYPQQPYPPEPPVARPPVVLPPGASVVRPQAARSIPPDPVALAADLAADLAIDPMTRKAPQRAPAEPQRRPANQPPPPPPAFEKPGWPSLPPPPSALDFSKGLGHPPGAHNERTQRWQSTPIRPREASEDESEAATYVARPPLPPKGGRGT